MKKILLASALFLTLHYSSYISAARQSDIKTSSLLSTLSLNEKLAQLQSASIYIIEQSSDEEGNISTDSLRKYYPHGIGLMNIDFALSKTKERHCRLVNSLKK